MIPNNARMEGHFVKSSDFTKLKRNVDEVMTHFRQKLGLNFENIVTADESGVAESKQKPSTFTVTVCFVR